MILNVGIDQVCRGIVSVMIFNQVFFYRFSQISVARRPRMVHLRPHGILTNANLAGDAA